ncbi:tRNA methyltransferase 10 A-like protein [Dinothrombium tinctorium]|uniref:tRNA (guanine(9)-N(1))-methyltransferase n=1 Tax=Dinothrombium tinctorium TaxID=1965070 RepID=A0A443QC12_9ACAR|nr:tRNA methyltransferase 10 A-like protein [Dinothrombium tinctorium]
MDATANEVKMNSGEQQSKAALKYAALAKEAGVCVEDIEKRVYSKRELKRILKNKKWRETKEERRKLTKEKRRKKKAKLVCTKITSMRDSPNKMSLAVDLSLESFMNDRELAKLMKQLQRCYAINRRFSEPCQFYLTSFSGRVKQCLSEKQPGFESWDIHSNENHFLDVFRDRKHNVIFLSSDSPNVLPDAHELRNCRDNSIFIIGGLVDHNFHKGLTLKRAQEAGLKHARLPIDKYVKIYMTKVLAVNHVFEIMLLASTGVDWEEAFKRVIPQRKFKKVSQSENSSSESEPDSESESKNCL